MAAGLVQRRHQEIQMLLSSHVGFASNAQSSLIALFGSMH
jgi:hypothetical protein